MYCFFFCFISYLFLDLRLSFPLSAYKQLSLNYNILDLSIVDFVPPPPFQQPLHRPWTSMQSSASQMIIHKEMKCSWQNMPASSKGHVGNNFPAVVIGPTARDDVIQLSPLLTILGLPQISYWTDSYETSDKLEYPYFASTIPGCKSLVSAVMAFLNIHSLNHVYAIVSQHSIPSRSAYAVFREQFLAHVRTATGILHEQYFSPGTELKIITPLNNTARVVVVFAHPREMTKLLTVSRSLSMSQSLWLLASAADMPLDILPSLVGERPPGFITFLPKAQTTDWEDDFLGHLTDINCTSKALAENWHLRAFYESTLNCHCTQELPNDLYPGSSKRKFACKAGTHLTRGDAYMLQKAGPLLAAIRSTLQALNATLTSQCTGIEHCSPNWSATASRSGFIQELRSQVTPCPGNSNNTCNMFSPTLDSGAPEYDILNWNTTSSKAGAGMKFLVVGHWYGAAGTGGDNLTMIKPIDWAPDLGVSTVAPSHLTCQPACSAGHYASLEAASPCWSCAACDGMQQYQDQSGETSCKQCGEKFRPNSKHTACVRLSASSFPYSSLQPILIALWSVVACLLVSTIFVLVRNRHTPVVTTIDFPSNVGQLMVSITLHLTLLPLLIATFPATNTMICRYLVVKKLLEATFNAVTLLLYRMRHSSQVIKKWWREHHAVHRLVPKECLAVHAVASLLLLPCIPITAYVLLPSGSVSITATVADTEIITACSYDRLQSILILTYLFALQIAACVAGWRSPQDDARFNERYLVIFTSSLLVTQAVLRLLIEQVSAGTTAYLLNIMSSFFQTVIMWSGLYSPRLYIILIRPEHNKLAYASRQRRRTPISLSFQENIRVIIRRFSTARDLDDNPSRLENIGEDSTADLALSASESDDAFTDDLDVAGQVRQRTHTSYQVNQSSDLDTRLPANTISTAGRKTDGSQSSLPEAERYLVSPSHPPPCPAIELYSTPSPSPSSALLSGSRRRSISDPHLHPGGDIANTNIFDFSPLLLVPAGDINTSPKRPSWPFRVAIKQVARRSHSHPRH